MHFKFYFSTCDPCNKLFIVTWNILSADVQKPLLPACLMGQYCFERWRLLSSSVTLPAAAWERCRQADRAQGRFNLVLIATMLLVWWSISVAAEHQKYWGSESVGWTVGEGGPLPVWSWSSTSRNFLITLVKILHFGSVEVRKCARQCCSLWL